MRYVAVQELQILFVNTEMTAQLYCCSFMLLSQF